MYFKSKAIRWLDGLAVGYISLIYMWVAETSSVNYVHY